MASAVQSPGKLRLHKKHYLNEVVREKVDYRRRESKPVDLSSISKISQFIPHEGGEDTEPESSLFKAAGSYSRSQPAGAELLQESLSSFFSDSKAESAYLSALTAVEGLKETEDGTSKHELLQFIDESFDLPDEKKKQLQDKVTTLEKPTVTLTCRVLNGEGLVTKDTGGSGSIDVFCQLGVLREDGQEKGSFLKQKKNIKDWQKEKLVESIGMTSVKSGSLEPEWNEEIQLSATKPRREKLVLEIWNGDETNGGASKNKSFVGRFFYPLQYIPTTGEKKTLPLRSHSGKSERGFVTVNLTIDQESCLLDFTDLTSAMVNVSAKESGGYVRRWNGQLTPMAEKLLEEYASLNDIDELYIACIRLSVLVRYHKLYAVNMAAICDLIRRIKQQVAIVDTNPPMAHEYWEKLFTDLSGVSDEMEGIMKNHLLMFDLELEDNADKIKEWLQTLRELYTFQPFTERLPPGNGSLKEMLETCITVAVPVWFTAQEAQTQPQVQTEKGRLIAFRDLSQFCLKQCQISLKVLKPIFAEAGVDYFSIFYTALDSCLGGEAESKVKEHSASSDSTTYEVYLIFREMADLARHIESAFNPLYGIRENLRLPRYYKWFREMVKNWITLAVEKCNVLIIKAVEADSAIAVTDLVKFSTSAVDVTGFLLQIGEFWKNLNWPEAIVGYGFASTVMEEINKCAQFYVEEVAKRLTNEDVFDEEGRFRATEKLCIVLNNMQHVREELFHLEERLEFESFYRRLDSEDESTLGSQCRAMVKKLLGSADDDIYNRMSKIMAEITEKLSPDIRKLVQGVVSESKIDAAKDEFEILAPLMDYLTNNLQVFADNLFPAVFEIILCNLWQLSLDCVHKCLKEVQLKKGNNSAELHQRSFTMLSALKDFYHSDGNGIREEDLKTDTYNRLFSQLDVLRLSTEELIRRFLSEFVEVQRRELEGEKEEGGGGQGLGSLHASVCYLKEETVVEVNVIKGEGLPSTSKNGWFVQACLMPPPIGGRIPWTCLQKNTKDPVFDDFLKLPSTDEAMTAEGAVLFLSLFNHPVIGSDSFTALCAIACKDIPHSTSDNPQRRNFILPLFQFIDLTFATAELEFRAECGDGRANSFIKSNFIKKVLSFLPRPRSRSRSRSRSNSSVSYLENSQAVQLNSK